MSLTSMLSGKEEMDVKLQSILRSVIPKKNAFSSSGDSAFNTKMDPIVPYRLTKRYYSSVLGTSFDYMARLIVAKRINQTVFDTRVAEMGLHSLERNIDEETNKLLIEKYKEAHRLIEKYLTSLEFSYLELLATATFLARLEHIVRTGMPPMDVKYSLIDEEEKEIIIELEGLCHVFNDKFIKENLVKESSTVIFNPHFGIMSKCCGGADADIYIDGTLYDFKSTKENGYKWKDIAQVFGYYSFHTLANQLDDTDSMLFSFPVKRLAFYKARYGVIDYIDIDSIPEEDLDLMNKGIFELFETRIDYLQSLNLDTN